VECVERRVEIVEGLIDEADRFVSGGTGSQQAKFSIVYAYALQQGYMG
jgi:hypothetical protein